MPENNPFEIRPETKPVSNLSAREKLFADMGLSPQGTPLDPVSTETDFLNADLIDSNSHDFISLSEPQAKTQLQAAEEFDEEELIVDAIFTSTELPETSHPEAPAAIESLTLEPAHVENSFEPLKPIEPAEAKLETAASEWVAEPATQTESLVVDHTATPESEALSALKSLDRASFEPILGAYTDLQQKLAANQALISAEREAIAALRNQMRQLNAQGHEASSTRLGLDQSRQLVQADSCENLIQSLGQVNQLIQQDSQRAMQLMAPIKLGIEILELRVKHVSAIESLLAHMQEGLKLQEQLAGADKLMHDLSNHLGLNLAQA